MAGKKQLIGRDARTGRFIPFDEAINKPGRALIVAIKQPAKPQQLSQPVTPPPENGRSRRSK